jgi:hypothetical protein
MRRATLPLLALPLALGLALAAPATAQEERTISVTGRGEVASAPDMAVIGLGVVEEAETARAAMDAASTAAAAVLARLEEIGIAERDIQTSDLRLAPVWSNPKEGQQREIVGFQAANQLTVRVRDLSGLGAALDAVVSDGANRFGGLRFTMADPAPLMEDARRRAVEDATARARTLADAAGVSLGPVRTITEHGGGRPRPVMMEAARSDMAGAPPVAPGEIELSVEVSMVFEIAVAE